MSWLSALSAEEITAMLITERWHVLDHAGESRDLSKCGSVYYAFDRQYSNSSCAVRGLSCVLSAGQLTLMMTLTNSYSISIKNSA